MEIKDYYKELSKKKGLPNFEDINSEFEIDDIKDGNFAKKIAEKISCKAEKYRKIFEEFLQADGNSLAALIEIKNMSEADTEKINSIYKELILIERGCLLAEIENSEDAFSEFIKNSIQKWKELKSPIKEILKKAKDSWKADIKVKEERGYLG